MKLSTLALALFALLPLCSCATICSPGPDYVPVNTEPAGARVYHDGMLVGTTPTTIPMRRETEGRIEIKMAGYKTVRVDRDKVLNGWFFPGALSWILLWPAVPISMLVDLASGNQGKYSTAPIYATLVPGREDEVIDLTPRRPARTDDATGGN